MDDDDGAHISCATYTHARRHPMVLGHIGGWSPPFQLSVTQLAIIGVTFWIEMQTWPLWGAYLPRIPGVVVAVVIPCVLAWVVRRTRIEGRNLPRAALGWASLLWTPRHGRVGGRPHRDIPATRPGKALVYVAADDDSHDWYGGYGGGGRL